MSAKPQRPSARLLCVILACSLGVACGTQLRTAGRLAIPAPTHPPVASSSAGGSPAHPVDAMSVLQLGPLKLDDDELARLASNGFVITNRKRFPSFVEGWLTIYKSDLPLYVSADALLHVVHRSYDRMLQDLELSVLIPGLQLLLSSMRQHLADSEGASAPSRQSRQDADLFLGVALGLLEGRHAPPIAGADAAAIARWTDKATASQGATSETLFGSSRWVDFSQFKPRGHYALDLAPPQLAQAAPVGSPANPVRPADRPSLRRYFQAMTWLGRIDARIAVPDRRTRVLQLDRRELALACALRTVMQTPEMAAWKQLETTMDAFVGDRDAMGPADVDRLLAELGAKSCPDLDHVPDAKLLATILHGSYGKQRMTGDILLSDDQGGATPLPRSFSLTGQRYVVDSDVLSAVVHDRVPGRLMPSPLDVAFAVLENDDAKSLLRSDLTAYGYRSTLEGQRERVDGGGDAFWDTSLYTLWLGAIRALSAPAATRLNPTMQADAWRRRVLSTELASWAELRHDTILYVKQSYTFGFGCSFPDAYVDPYPAFYDELAKYAAKGQALVGALDLGKAANLRSQMSAFFDQLAVVSRTLGHVAQEEMHGERPSSEELAFFNQAVAEDPPESGGCTAPVRRIRGWYVRLFYGGDDPLAFKPTIADVHTQPTDAAGNMVGRVLHVGTGWPRTMVVDVDLGRGKTPFVGVVSAYSEVVTDNFQRYTDDEWKRAIAADNHEDVEWMRDIVIR
ncbi:MAG TPA: DUF3160 domain-containing protein [Polyangiaceae bacterium]|nr:DUF3160 domain-containing protein [Polyangiaceae bacterium]